MNATALLSAEDLDVSIGPTRVTRGLQLRLEAGQTLGVLGRNGSGKTTLLRTLAGLHRPDHGTVRLDGEPLQAIERRRIAQRLGMLLQHTHYAFEASCEDIALIGRHPHLGALASESAEDHARARQALMEVGLAELAGRSCMDLSGGESRRLALATLLVQDPAVMLLDEPTNHLDPANQVAVLDVVIRRQRQDGRAAIFALHDVNLATCYCSHVLMLHGEGEWQYGPTEERLNEGELSRLYGCRVRRVDDGQQQVFAVAGRR